MSGYEALQRLAATSPDAIAVRALWEMLVRQDEAIARLEDLLGVEHEDDATGEDE